MAGKGDGVGGSGGWASAGGAGDGRSSCNENGSGDVEGRGVEGVGKNSICFGALGCGLLL